LPQLQKYLESALTKRFACPTPGDVEAKWETLRDIVCDATMEHLKNVSTANIKAGSLRIMQSCNNL